MCSGSEAGSYLRLIDSCITQLKAQVPSRTRDESKEEEDPMRKQNQSETSLCAILRVEVAVFASTCVIIQGYLAHKKLPPPKSPTVGLCLGPNGGARGGGCFL